MSNTTHSNNRSSMRRYMGISALLFAAVLLSACVSNKKFEAYRQAMSQEVSDIRSSVSRIEDTNKSQNKQIKSLQEMQSEVKAKLNASIEQLNASIEQLNALNKKVLNMVDTIAVVQASVNELGERLKIVEKYKEDQEFFNKNIVTETGKTSSDLFSIDEYVLGIYYEGTSPSDYDELVALVTKNAKTDYEKARAIFIWIANNISYDVSYSTYDKDEAFRKRKGVCAAYSGLYQELCRRAGLEVKTISGICRDWTYKPGDNIDSKRHAWNAVKDDNDRWFFVDATWGAGSVNDGKFTRRIASYWFDSDPSIFALSHLPTNSSEQMLDNPVSRSEFETLPPIYPNLAMMGFDGKQLLQSLRNDVNHSFPKMFPFDGLLKINEMPLSNNLSSSQTYEFTVTAPKEYKIAIIQGNKWTYFQGDGETKTVKYQPVKGGFTVSVNYKNDGYWPVFEYDVK